MENLSFKNWLMEQYEVQDLREIAEHGCASAAPGGMIYYSETSALYDRFCDDLHDTLGDWVDSIGFLPEYIAENIGDARMFKNAIVWAIAEYHANDILAEAEQEI
jgi:hypothetical protein